VCAFPPSHGHPVNKESGGLTEFKLLAKPTYFLPEVPARRGLAATPVGFLATLFFGAAAFCLCLGGAFDLAAAGLAAFAAVAALVGDSKTSAVGLDAGVPA